MNFEKLSTQGPDFNFIEYFEGHTKASGWFADRFGNVKRHFCGDFFGQVENDVFNLNEILYYSDGVIEKRVWSVAIDPAGEFTAESDSLVGSALGIQKGSGLRMKYVMNVMVAEDKTWKLDMNDFMFYQTDHSLHNITKVSKWGIRIGNVSTQYTKHNGELLCLERRDGDSVTSGLRSVASADGNG